MMSASAHSASLDVDLGGLLGGNNTDTATVTVGGSSSGGIDADVNLGGNPGGSNGTLLDLFGNELVTADLSAPNGSSTIDLLGGGDTTVVVGGPGIIDDLFGSGVTTAQVGLGLPDADGVVEDLFGPLSGGNGGGGNGGNGGGGGNGSGGGVQVAALGNVDACYSPNSMQIDKLANRHVYTAETFASWRGATTLKIVRINLCDAAGARIEGNANVAALQNYLASFPAFSARLKAKGFAPDDVIAVDRTGNTLIVYVS
jgi:hypothetical protein